MTRKRKGKKAPPRKFHAISVPAEMVPVVEEVRDNMSERLGVPKLPIATVVAHAISMLHRMHAGRHRDDAPRGCTPRSWASPGGSAPDRARAMQSHRRPGAADCRDGPGRGGGAAGRSHGNRRRGGE